MAVSDRIARREDHRHPQKWQAVEECIGEKII